MKLILQDIEKSFGEKNVLAGCSCTFEQGKIYGLLGRNGAGKTTLFNSIYGEYKDVKGQDLIEDEEGQRMLQSDDVELIYAQPMLPEFLTSLLSSTAMCMQRTAILIFLSFLQASVLI